MSDTVVARPPKLARVVLPVLLVVSTGCLVAALVLSPPKRQHQLPPVEVAPPVTVPAFTCTDRSGKPVTNADLLDKVWVASFVFTRCEGTCPKVTGTMHQLQRDLDLAGRPDLRLVTFTMDPDHDTPDVLQKYAQSPNWRADSDRWLFLTGTNDQVRDLMKNTFKLAFQQNANPATPPSQKYDHGTFVFVVDKKGRVRGHFDGLKGAGDETGERYRDSCGRLVKTVNELLVE